LDGAGPTMHKHIPVLKGERSLSFPSSHVMITVIPLSHPCTDRDVEFKMGSIAYQFARI